MWHFLQKIRSQPEEKRKQVVFFLSFFITGFIFILWVVSFVNLKLEPLNQSKNNLSASAISEKDTGPIKELGNFFGDIFDTTKSGFEKIKIEKEELKQGLIESQESNSMDKDKIQTEKKPISEPISSEIYFE